MAKDQPAKNHSALHQVNHPFISQAASPARNSEQLTGVPASVTIAQAILESGWGKHHMGTANNYFGIKAQTVNGKISFGNIARGFVDQSTKEHIKKLNKDITITAHFRSYKTMEDSFLDHGLFIKNNPRYSAALTNYSKNSNADDFALGLQKAGYATDPQYAKLLISIMKKYDLYQYNKKPADKSLPQVKK